MTQITGPKFEPTDIKIQYQDSDYNNPPMTSNDFIWKGNN